MRALASIFRQYFSWGTMEYFDFEGESSIIKIVNDKYAETQKA